MAMIFFGQLMFFIFLISLFIIIIIFIVLINLTPRRPRRTLSQNTSGCWLIRVIVDIHGMAPGDPAAWCVAPATVTRTATPSMARYRRPTAALRAKTWYATLQRMAWCAHTFDFTI
jgi:hypothetical protein